MNADVYRGPWGGANCRDSLAQPLRTCNCPQGMRGGCEGRGVSITVCVRVHERERERERENFTVRIISP